MADRAVQPGTSARSLAFSGATARSADLRWAGLPGQRQSSGGGRPCGPAVREVGGVEGAGGDPRGRPLADVDTRQGREEGEVVGVDVGQAAHVVRRRRGAGLVARGGVRALGGVLVPRPDAEERGDVVEHLLGTAHEAAERQQQPLGPVVDVEPAPQLFAVQPAHHHRRPAHLPRGPARRQSPEQREVAEDLDGLAEAGVGRLPVPLHRPLGEGPLDRVAEAGDQPHVGVVPMHPPERARPPDVRRRRVAGDLLAGVGAPDGVAAVVGRGPVEPLVVEEVQLLGVAAGDVPVSHQHRVERRRRGLLHADDRERDRQQVSRRHR